MKKQKILFYVFKWFALIFLSFLIVKENHSKIMTFLLIGFVSVILIWEGIRDFIINNKTPDKNS
jgi:hypothetical protein